MVKSYVRKEEHVMSSRFVSGLKQTRSYCGDFAEILESNAAKGVFAGEPGEPWSSENPQRFRVNVPGVSTGAILPGAFLEFFDRELFYRFLKLPYYEQAKVVEEIMKAMKEKGTEELYYEVQWSPSKKRIIRIGMENAGLIFQLL